MVSALRRQQAGFERQHAEGVVGMHCTAPALACVCIQPRGHIDGYHETLMLGIKLVDEVNGITHDAVHFAVHADAH